MGNPKCPNCKIVLRKEEMGGKDKRCFNCLEDAGIRSSVWDKQREDYKEYLEWKKNRRRGSK